MSCCFVYPSLRWRCETILIPLSLLRWLAVCGSAGGVRPYDRLVGVGTVQPGVVAAKRRGTEVLARRLRRARHRGLGCLCRRRPDHAGDGVSGAEGIPLLRASAPCDGDMAADRGGSTPSLEEQAFRSTCLALKPLAFPPSPLPSLLSLTSLLPQLTARLQGHGRHALPLLDRLAPAAVSLLRRYLPYPDATLRWRWRAGASSCGVRVTSPCFVAVKTGY
jgi:hypothetical protein